MNILENIALLWIVIGLGNWARHIFHCGGCKDTIQRFPFFFLSGVQAMGIWPIDIYILLRKAHEPPQGAQLPPGMEVVEISVQQRQGETDAEFQKRVLNVVARKNMEAMAKNNRDKQ